MASINNGPASTQSPLTIAGFIPVNTMTNSSPVLANESRLLAAARGLSLATTGDIALGIINASAYAIQSIGVCNAQLNGVPGSVAAASLSINTGPAVSGVSLSAPAALATLTGGGIFAVRTVVPASLLLVLSAQTIYLNVGVAVPGGTVDVFVWGVDLS